MDHLLAISQQHSIIIQHNTLIRSIDNILNVFIIIIINKYVPILYTLKYKLLLMTAGGLYKETIHAIVHQYLPICSSNAWQRSGSISCVIEKDNHNH